MYLFQYIVDPASITKVSLDFDFNKLFLKVFDCFSKTEVDGIEMTFAIIPSPLILTATLTAKDTSEPVAIIVISLLIFGPYIT